MITVKYCGPFSDHTGYGEATRNAIMALYVVGVNLITEKAKFTTGDVDLGPALEVAESLSHKSGNYKIKILHVTPDLYKDHYEPGKYHIGHLFWETDKLPESWIAGCNLMNEIWTGCQYTADAIRSSGVTAKIVIFPQAVNTEIRRVRPFNLNLPSEHLIFYSVIDWNERKNPRALLEAYWKEFKDHDDTVLLIKTGRGNYNQQEVEKIHADIRNWKANMGFTHYPKVMVVAKLMSKDELLRLHSTGNCFVSTHRGEGWGIPQVEAVLCGNTVLSTNLGGVHEYWGNKEFRLLKYKLVPIDQVYNKYYDPSMKWAEVLEEDVRSAMRRVYKMWSAKKSRRILAILPSKAAKFVRASFSYQVVGELMKIRLEDIEAKL